MSIELTEPSGGAPDDRPSVRRRGPRLPGIPGTALIVALVAANFGIWMAFFSPVILTLPLRVGALYPDSKTSVLSLLLGVSAVFGLVTGPMAGRLSDRSTSRWGRRRPWLLGGTSVGFLGLAIEAFSPDAGWLLIGVCLVAIGFAATSSMILALIPEHVARQRRGLVSGLIGVTQALAVIAGLAAGGALSATSLAAALLVPGVLGSVAVIVLCVILPDRQLDPADRPPFSWGGLARAYWINPRRQPDFGWAWLSRFLLIMGFAGVTNYQVFFLSDQLGVPAADSAKYVGVGTGLQVVGVIVASIAAGYVSDRVHRRKVFVVLAAVASVASLVVLAFATALPLFFVGMAASGLAQGVYLAVDLALITDLLPDHRTNDGRDLGFFNLANQLPQTLAPAVAPLFLAIGFGASAGKDNYTALFLAGATFAAISAVAVTRVRRVR